MKVVFFDLTKEDKIYFEKNLPKNIVGHFYSESFDSTYIPDNETQDAEAISVFVSGKIDENLLKKFPNLKYIFTRSVGFDHIDINYCNLKNIKIFNAKHSEAPVFWSPDENRGLIGKVPDAGKDRGQKEKGATEDDGWMA